LVIGWDYRKSDFRHCVIRSVRSKPGM